MRFLHSDNYNLKQFILAVLSIITFLTISNNVNGQQLPPRPVEVTPTAQTLSFGAFYHGSTGGTITIDAGGSRSASGEIVLLNMGYSYSSALFHLVANPGTVISILNGNDISLTGSNGGTMTLHLGDSNPLSPFVITTTPPVYTLFTIGGSLTVGNPLANPPGNYSGIFEITFIQE